MTPEQIALTAIVWGLGGWLMPRVGFALMTISGVLYLTLGWTPFGKP